MTHHRQVSKAKDTDSIREALHTGEPRLIPLRRRLTLGFFQGQVGQYHCWTRWIRSVISGAIGASNSVYSTITFI